MRDFMKGNLDSYVELTKPKVTLLNLLVGVTCFVLAAYPQINLSNLVAFSVAGYLAAGGCAVLNCVYDRDIDSLMPRTSKRAIPSEKVSSKAALLLGAVMLGAGLSASYIFFNPLTTVMLAFGAIFYLLVYTVWLKRISVWNVVIGGAAGCFAGLAGWTAAANTLSVIPLLVGLVDFLWTPGHLWGLAIKRVREYKAAGIPMLPVKSGLKRTAQTAFMFNLATVAASLLLPILGTAGLIFTFAAIFGGAVLLFETSKLLTFPSEGQGLRVFFVSMPYLACVMVGLLVDKLLLASLS